MSIVKTCGSITLSEIEDGIDVTGIIEQYYKSSSATELIGGSWTSTYPGWESGKYIWTKTITTYSNGESTETTPICVTGDKGANGRGISYVDVYFYQSSSATELKDGSWLTTAPTWVNGKYVWSKTITTYDDGNTDETTPVCITGAKGETGEGALTVVIGNESQNIPCTETGIASSAFLINIPFAGYKGTSRVACTVSVGTLPSGVTLKTNTASTTSADGSIVLNVANGATFGGSSVLTGEITLTFTLENKSIIKKFTWTKTKDGAASINYILEPSSLVIKKGYDNILSPSTITFSAYLRTGNVTTRTVYAGRFIISESTDGTTFTNKYSSASNESSKTYTPSSTNVKAIRCILYASGGTTTQLDMQTVVILTDIDNIDSELETIRTSISGVESKVDANTKSITDKVWQDDITNSINNYDSTTTESIRSRVSQVEQDVNGIKSTVSDVQTTLTEKADGSTVSKLTEKVSNLEQDADGFKQTVSSTYATKGELSNQSTTLRSEITQTANEIKQRLTDDEGNITSITERIGSVTTEISDAKGSSTTLQARLEGIESTVIDAENNLQTQITQNTEQIASRVTKTEVVEAVNKIEIGGRNLYKGTKNFTGDLWLNLSKWIETDEVYNEFKVLKKSSYYGGLCQNIYAIEGETYTFSGFIKTDAPLNWNIVWYCGTQNDNSASCTYIYRDKCLSVEETDFKRIYMIFNVTKSGIIRPGIEIYDGEGNLYVCGMKLEKGNKATDWSPAPEDVENIINNVESNINQRADNIELSVAQKENIPVTAVRYIRDWLNGIKGASSIDNKWVECDVITQGTNIASGIIPTYKNSSLTTLTVSNPEYYTDEMLLDEALERYINSTENSCLEIDLGEVYYNIDYIRVWHYYEDNRVYNHKMQISTDGISWVTIYDSDIAGGYAETSYGKVYYLNNAAIAENITSLNISSNQIESRVENIEGNFSSIKEQADKIESIVGSESENGATGLISSINNLDNLISKLRSEYEQYKSDNGTSISTLTQTMNEITSRIATVEGNTRDISEIRQDAKGWQALFAQLDMYDMPEITTNISIDINGITVTNPITKQQTRITIDEFSGWYNNEKIFWIDKDTTKTRRLLCEKGWDTGADFIKMTTNSYTYSDGRTLNGVAYVKSGGSS